MPSIGPIGFSGGYVSDADVYNLLSDDKTLTLDGFVPWAKGCKTADGMSNYGTIPNTASIQGLYYWQDPAQIGVSNRDILIAMGNAKCYTSPFNSISYTDRTAAITLPATGIYTFDSLNGILIIANSGFPTTSLAPFKITSYTSNIALLGGSPPVANLVRVVNSFCFLAQNLSSSTTLSRVYWSNVNDPETWGSSNYIDVRPGDGDVITGLSSIGTDLIIFKQTSIWRLSTTTISVSGTTTLGPLTLISDRYGAQFFTCNIDSLPDGTIVFMGIDNHLYQTDGASFVDLSHAPFPSSNIRATLISPISGLQFQNAAYVKVDSTYKRIFVLVPQPSVVANRNMIFTYYYEQKSWSVWTSMSGTSSKFTYPQIMPTISNSYGPYDRHMVMGDSRGGVWSLSPWTTSIQNIDGIDIVCTAEVSIVMDSTSSPEFIPRSLMIPINIPGGTGKGTLAVKIGYDGTYQASNSYSSSMASFTTLQRIIVPITFTSGSGKKPITMQVKITMTGSSGLNSAIVDSLYISNEVLT